MILSVEGAIVSMLTERYTRKIYNTKNMHQFIKLLLTTKIN